MLRAFRFEPLESCIDRFGRNETTTDQPAVGAENCAAKLFCPRVLKEHDERGGIRLDDFSNGFDIGLGENARHIFDFFAIGGGFAVDVCQFKRR